MLGYISKPTQSRKHSSLAAGTGRARAWPRPANNPSRRLLGACAALIVLLAGLAISLPAASQPTSPNIQLEVHNHASSGSDGFTDTTASNGAIYSYRYSGGEGNGGDVIFRARGRVTVNVHLSDGRDYSIDDVSFTGDIHNQLSWVSSGQASPTAVIQDINDQVQTAQYKVTVRDKANHVSIPCDPMITNK